MVAKGKIEYFNSLLIGVKEYLEQGKKYPYPDLLMVSMNDLSLEFLKTSRDFPKTMQGFLKLLEKPVKEWCPEDWIPSEYDSEFALLSQGVLSEEATRYMESNLAK